jgi:hypothetical protein
MANRRKVRFPLDYNPNEKMVTIVENSIVAKTLQTDLGLCPITRVIDALEIIAGGWNLRLNRPQEFSLARRILINSILYN